MVGISWNCPGLSWVTGTLGGTSRPDFCANPPRLDRKSTRQTGHFHKWLQSKHVREQKTGPLVNHAFARVTPAIFVIFVVTQGLSSKALVVLVRTQMRQLRRFRQKPPLFGWTKARFTKGTVFGTPNMEMSRRISLCLLGFLFPRCFSGGLLSTFQAPSVKCSLRRILLRTFSLLKTLTSEKVFASQERA